MSLGLILTNIATYTNEIDTQLLIINAKQAELGEFTDRDKEKTPQAKQARKELSKAQMLYNMFKTFLDFWQESFKDFIQLLRKNQELSGAGR